MSEEYAVTNLIAAFLAQQRLYELEVQFLCLDSNVLLCRKALRDFWPHAQKAFNWCAERIDSDIRAAIACDKIAGVAGKFLQQERGRHQLIEWREIVVRGTELAIVRGGFPNSPEFDLVHDLIGHLSYLGYLHYENGNPSRARAVLERALHVGEEHDRHFADATALLHLAFVAITEEKLDEGEELLQRALMIQGDASSPTMEAAIRNARGVIYGRHDQHEAARNEYDRVIALYEAMHDQGGLCTALINRAGELADLGLLDLARQDLENADGIARQLGSAAHIGLLQINLARFRARENPEVNVPIFDLLHEAKAQFTSIGDRVQRDRAARSMQALYNSILERDPAETTFADRKTALWELVNLASEQGDTDHALELAEQLLDESDINGTDEDRLEALLRAAHCNTLVRNYPAAHDRAVEALALLDRTRSDLSPDRSETMECDLRSFLGQSLRQLGEHEASAWQYRAAIAIAETVGDDELLNRLRGNLGLTLTGLGQFDEALTLLREIAEDLRASGNYSLAGRAMFNVAHALFQQGERQAAREEAGVALALLEMIADPMADEIRRQMAGWLEALNPSGDQVGQSEPLFDEGSGVGSEPIASDGLETESGRSRAPSPGTIRTTDDDFATRLTRSTDPRDRLALELLRMFERQRRFTLGDALRAAGGIGLTDDDALAAAERLARPLAARLRRFYIDRSDSVPRVVGSGELQQNLTGPAPQRVIWASNIEVVWADSEADAIGVGAK
jgi:tetratricopeptide (TPR) repeat protein